MTPTSSMCRSDERVASETPRDAYPHGRIQNCWSSLGCERCDDSAFSENEDIAPSFAEQAALALVNAQAYDAARQLADQLEEAIESRSVISQAIGVLRARRQMSADEAFGELRKQSQDENRKLRLVAEDLLRALDDESSNHDTE